MSLATPSRGRYITDSQGGRIAVVLEIKEYEALLDQLEELEALRAYDEAKASGDERIPFDQAVSELETH